MTPTPITAIPKHVQEMPLGQRIRWARRRAGMSHDRLIETIGRSNRSHLIKIERGDHMPRRDLRDALADGTGVPRELFTTDEDEEASQMPLSRDDFRMLGDLMARLGASLVAAEA